MSQAARMERLRQLDSELRATIVLQQKKKNEFSEHLAHTVFRIQQLASSRQIYQEVDLKDSALAATSKECEDCKDRDFRLKLSIESLKQAVPRFLMKVTKVAHPKPTENQVRANSFPDKSNLCCCKCRCVESVNLAPVHVSCC
jgi:hypothetical protein